MSTPLTLAEELLLLAHRGDDGRRVGDGTTLTVGVAGSLVAELAVEGRVELDDDRVRLLDPAPMGDPELDDVLSQVAAEPRPRKPKWWISKLNKRDLPKRLLARLADRGVLRPEEHRTLGLFATTRYVELDPRPEAEVRARLEAALGGAEPSTRTAALVALLSGCGLDRKVFPGIGRRELKRRTAEITEGDWAGEATRKVIQSIHAAAAASTAAIAAATSAGSS